MLCLPLEISLANGEALTLAALTEDRWAFNTYDPTFFGVVDHTARIAYNNGPTGLPHDPTKVLWGMQFEATYKTGPLPGDPIFSEWFLQYDKPGGGAPRRPIFVTVDQNTNSPNTNITGEFHVSNSPGGIQRILVPDDATSMSILGPCTFLTALSGNSVSIRDTDCMFFKPLYLNVNNVPFKMLDAAGTGYVSGFLVDGADKLRLGSTGGGYHALVAIDLCAQTRELGPGGTKPVNVETLLAGKVLTTADSQWQILSASAPQDVEVPASTFNGLWFWIENQGGANLTLKDAGGATLTTLTPNQGCYVRCNGILWVVHTKVATLPI